MFRIVIESRGQVAYQKDVSTHAYAEFEVRELADVSGNATLVEAGDDVARYQIPTGFIRAYAL